MKFIFDDPVNTYEPKPTLITYGYDRSAKSWCIIVEDQEGNEIESSYLGTKEGCLKWIDFFKEKYGITATKKYKAY